MYEEVVMGLVNLDRVNSEFARTVSAIRNKTWQKRETKTWAGSASIQSTTAELTNFKKGKIEKQGCIWRILAKM
jgi:hypothetical protein